MASPMHCRSCAFRCFARQMPTIDSAGGAGLMAAALAIAMHELEDVDAAAIDRQLQGFADTVQARVPHLVERLLRREPVNPEPVLAHLHSVLFDEFGLCGNAEDYYNSHNSYIPCVLETRRGIPITLTLIYKNVAERLGLVVHGINAPGHFFAGIDPAPGAAATPNACCARMYIDAFDGGRFLTKPEVFERLAKVLGRAVPPDKTLLAPAGNRQWLNRLLQNLQNIFALTRREADLAAMQEMAALLHGAAHDPELP